MEVLRLCFRRNAPSKLITLVNSSSMSSANLACKIGTNYKFAPTPTSLNNRIASYRCQLVPYSTSSPDSAKKEDQSSTSQQDEQTRAGAEMRNEDLSSSEEKQETGASNIEDNNSESGSVPPPSKSQTGEQLPSEQDEANRSLDKLYKVIELEVLAYEPSVLDSYQWFVLTAATHLGIKVGKCWSPLKSDKLRFQLLKSAFVHKKHVVHYEVRTYHRFLTFHKLTSSTADTFLEYIERNLPEGVGLKVTKVEVKPIPEFLQKEAAHVA